MSDLKDVHVVILETDPTCADLLVTVLQRAGAVVRQYWNPFDLYKDLPTDRADVLLLSLQQGNGLDAYSVCNILRSMPSGQSLPIVVVSGNLLEDEKPRLEANRINGFISKPIHPSQFRQQLLDILMNSQIIC
jgi:CheY-like chemotaxis protein